MSADQECDSPLVTVITPVYNAERYLQETLMSVIESTYPNIELIVVDDGSTDNSRNVAEAVRVVSKRNVRIYSQQNSGEAAADNLGLRLSKGKYVMFLSADDTIQPELIERSVDVLEKLPGVVVTYPFWMKMDGEGKSLEPVYPERFSFDALVGDMICLPGPGAVIRKSSIPSSGARRPEYTYISDYRQWLDLATQGDFHLIEENLASWRIHSQQQTSSASSAKLASELAKIMPDFYSEDNLPSSILKFRRQAISQGYYRAALQSLFSEGVPGRYYLLKSIIHLYRRGKTVPNHVPYRRSLITIGLIFSNPIGRLLTRFKIRR